MTRLVFLSSLLLVACSGGSDGGRAATKVVEIERTVQTGSSTTIQRSAMAYEGSHLTKIDQTRNGAPNGMATIVYGKSGIERIEYTAANGTRATEQLVYTNGKLSKLRFEVPGSLVDEDVLSYHTERPDLLKEITNTQTPVGGFATTRLHRFEYDGEERLAKTTTLQGQSTSSTELRYDMAGQIDRMTVIVGTSIAETYTYRYNEDGTLDEVTDSRNNRHELTYDKQGRVTEIRHVQGSTTTTTRYVYASGSVAGWTFAPEIPGSSFFDLAGNGFHDVEMLHGNIGISAGSGDDGSVR